MKSERSTASKVWGCKPRLFIAAAWVTVAVSASGCVSSRMSDRDIDRLFAAGRFDEAAARLKDGYKDNGEDEGTDSLLYVLDLGLALHYAGKDDEAIKVFLHADKLAEIKDYTSIAAEAGTLFTSENIKNYKAEDFENVLISVYLAICFASIGKTEDAIVEARRVNRKLELMVSEGKRKYQQNAFARYLSAALYESDREWNSAYLDYKKTRELNPDFNRVGIDLYRTAVALAMWDEAERWEAEYQLTEEDKRAAKQAIARGGGTEIIVIFENGISPEKVPHPQWYSIPKFYPRYNPVREAIVELNGTEKGRTEKLFDVERIAIQNLEEKYGDIIAKKVAGVVAKESVALGASAATKEPWVGQLIRLIFYVSDQADIRSWKLLPRDFQIFRMPVEPGTHTVRIRPVGAYKTAERTVQVKKGQKVFLALRYMPGWD